MRRFPGQVVSLFSAFAATLRRGLELGAICALVLAGGNCAAQNAPTAPNWALPQIYTTAAYQNGVWIQTPATGQIGFTFTIPSTGDRSTAASVWTTAATPTLIRTLWMNRSYPVGTWGEIWDGNDDYGNQQPAGQYQIRLVQNNVSYTWDGEIGNTETDWGGPHNWDNSSSFPLSIAFANGEGCMSSMYNEGTYPAYCFPEATPNTNIQPLTTAYRSNTGTQDIATDGLHYYEMTQGYGTGLPISDWSGIFVSNLYPNGSTVFPVADGTLQGGSISENFSNTLESPAGSLGEVKIIDYSLLPNSALTAVAVQRNGNVLATGHGEYVLWQVSLTVPSADTIYFWNKTTGAALGSVTVPNPQKMAFDNNNNLWVLSGYGENDVVYEVTGISPLGMGTITITPTHITTPLAGLSNPMGLTTSPTTGDVFVIDGGANQQVLEFNTSTYQLVSTLGTKGGYGTGSTCNPTVNNQKFLFDPGPTIGIIHIPGKNGPWVAGINIDETGGLWLMDLLNYRVLHYTYGGGAWNYVNRIVKMDWNYYVSATDGDPTRIFGGFLGFNEYKRNYSVPLVPGDAEAPGGNGAWALVRSWLPCVLSNNTAWNAEQQISQAFTMPNGTIVVRADATQSTTDSQTPGVQGSAMYMFGTDGTFKYTDVDTLGKAFSLEPGTGNYYGAASSGSGSTFLYTVSKYPMTGYDSQGFPTWNLNNFSVVGSYTANVALGNPRMVFNTQWPTTSGIIPSFDVNANTIVAAGVPSFHLGGLPVNGKALQWQTMPQKDMVHPDGNGSYPSLVSCVNGGCAFEGGTQAQAKGNNIFAMFNGNWQAFACQYYHFTSDGMFLAEFGYLENANAPTTGVPGPGEDGYPPEQTNNILAPGFCGDVGNPAYVQNPLVNTPDYYMFIGDEGYRHGIHEWHISNLSSIQETTQVLSTLSGSTTTVTATPTKATYGSPVQLTATVKPPAGTTIIPGGTVSFSSSGLSTSLGTGTLDPTTGICSISVSTLPLGTDTITAIYAGSTAFSTSSGTATVVVAVATTTVSVSMSPVTAGTPVTAGYGQSLMISATVSSTGSTVSPTGTVTFDNGSTVLDAAVLLVNGVATFPTATLPLGASTISATYSPTGGVFTGSTGTEAITITPAATASTLTPSPTTASVGSPVTLTVAVTVPGTTLVPPGTVVFSNGSTVLGTVMLSNGVAALTLTTLPMGTDTITCVYTPTSVDFASSSCTAKVTVNLDADTVTVTPSTLTTTYGQNVTIGTKVSPSATAQIPSGTVAFSSGSTPLGSGTLDGTGSASTSTTILPVGMDTITVTYNGSSTFAGGSGTATVTVGTAPTSLTLIPSATTALTGSSVTFAAQVSVPGTSIIPSGSVVFTSGSTVLGSVPLGTTGLASLAVASLPIGSDIVTAYYASTATLNSASASTTINVTDFALAASAPSITISRGSSGTIPLSFSGLGGFQGTVTIACASTTLTCSLSPPQVSIAGGATSASTLTISVPANLALLFKRLSVVSLASLLLFFPLRRRRWAFAPIVLLVALGGAIVGCGSSSGNAAPATLQESVIVTATSGAVSHSQTFLVTVP